MDLNKYRVFRKVLPLSQVGRGFSGLTLKKWSQFPFESTAQRENTNKRFFIISIARW